MYIINLSPLGLNPGSAPGLLNAPNTFIGLMNRVFGHFIGKFVVFFFNFYEILIYSNTEEDHSNHLKQVIPVLKKERLYENLKKFPFFTNKDTFLGYTVTPKGIQVD